MIKSVFVANRGEIAVRIIRACKEMGLHTTIGYSQADVDSLPVKMADNAICIGSARATDSYLHQQNILTAAAQAHCDALHPGVGFLSENAEFAQKVLDEDIVFIGPSPHIIALLGDKISAKKAARDAGMPIVPGSAEGLSSLEDVRKKAHDIGFPIILKAAAGGGGRGMRILYSDKDLQEQFAAAVHEAESTFSDGTVYFEHFIANPRHVEIQVMADMYSNVVHFGDRDCTVQHRFQKLLEETPSSAVSEDLRYRMGNDAVKFLRKLGYCGAGTVEYLVEGDKYYFMEVNTRIQVEHPITEEVTGIDLLKMQIGISMGEEIPFSQNAVNMQGYALECRINALQTGKVEQLHMPGGFGVRIDSYLYTGMVISPYYDALLAKVIVHAQNRKEGIARMICVLQEMKIEGEGLLTNIQWQLRILSHKKFWEGTYSTNFLMQENIIEG